MDTYKSIYCDLGWHGNEKRDIEFYKIVEEQLGYQKLGYEFIEVVLKSGTCSDITNYIIEEGIVSEELPPDILNFKINCDSNALNKIKNKVKNAYEKVKVIEQTKTKLKYETKASERFWDGQVFETERASFDLIVDLNLIEQVMFGSMADWVDPSEVWEFPNDEDDTEDTESAPAVDTGTDTGTDTSPSTTTDTDEGVTGEETTTPGSEPDCVPADDPNADLDNNPGDIPSSNCGNGVLDVLFGEQCDDGNNISGDGCNQYCMLEDNGAGIDENGGMCMDSEAVTFKTPSESGSSGYSNNSSSDNSSNNETDNGCPPGTFPSTEVSITGTEGGAPDGGIPQSENYPGPFIGGTLKNYPPSNRPNCPEGYSEVSGMGSATSGTSSASVTASGGDTLGINVGGTQYDIPKCIPTEFCASFDDIRSALFGKDWKEDEEKSKIAYSIEALFCVNLVKHTRPETPYRPDEGCIDCHIRAIVDSFYKALDTNVTPLANTTSGFGISNKWGPNMSFDLTTMVKQKLRLALPDPKTAKQKMEEAIEKAKSEQKIPTPKGASSNETATEKAERKLKEAQDLEKAIIEVTENYRNTNSSASDQAMFTRIKPLLIQMLQSFQVIQANYDQITREGALGNLASKNTCE